MALLQPRQASRQPGAAAGALLEQQKPEATAGDAAGHHVELAAVEMRYGETRAVAGVDLAIAQGEFLGLLGPSGSGKTSILMMVAGFASPTRGDVRIKGRSVLGLPPESRDIGVVFQNYALFPHMSVEENVAFPLEMRRLKAKEIGGKVTKALAAVSLESLRRRYPHELSGGQQQRVALARALVFEPPLLLMDEPLGALDKRLRQQMQLELRDLHRQLGTTILYVTHDQEEALALADRIAIFKDGRLVQIDTPSRLYREPRDRFVASFLGDCNFLPIAAMMRGEQAWHVRVGGYSGAVPPASGTKDGEGGRLAVRPHHISFASRGEAGLQARVRDVIFLGDCVDYVLETEGLGTLHARRPANASEPIHERGASLRLEWDWAQARVL